MTQRQKNLGVTEWGYEAGVVQGDFLSSFEAFKAKAATIKKGQYKGIDIIKMWIPEYADMDIFMKMKLEEAKPFLYGLDATMHESFVYTDTHGLDLLTVR